MIKRYIAGFLLIAGAFFLPGVASASSVSSTTTTVIVGATGVSVPVVGVGTSWVAGTTTFSVPASGSSNPGGATLTGTVTATSATTATLTFSAGTLPSVIPIKDSLDSDALFITVVPTVGTSIAATNWTTGTIGSASTGTAGTTTGAGTMVDVNGGIAEVLSTTGLTVLGSPSGGALNPVMFPTSATTGVLNEEVISYFNIPTHSGGNIYAFYDLLRWTTGNTCYYAQCTFSTSSSFDLVKDVAGANTLITANTGLSGTYSQGDEVEMLTSATGSSPTTLTVTLYDINNSDVIGTITATDSTASGDLQSAGGQVGVSGYNSGGSHVIYQQIQALNLAATATPTISPATGAYSTTQSVTISDATSGATIYYTTNGTTPTTASQVYSGTINVNNTSTIQAIATSPSNAQSGVSTASALTMSVAPATYYIDSVGGSDSNAGTSTGAAWQSLAKITSHGITAGDTYLLKGGDTWSQAGGLIINQGGTVSSPVTLGTYSTGNSTITSTAAGGSAIEIIDSPYVIINGSNIILTGPGVASGGSNTSTAAGLWITTTGVAISPTYEQSIWVTGLTISGYTIGIFGQSLGVSSFATGSSTAGSAGVVGLSDVRLVACTINSAGENGFDFQAYQSQTLPTNAVYLVDKNIYIDHCTVANVYGDVTNNNDGAGCGTIASYQQGMTIQNCCFHDLGGATGTSENGGIIYPFSTTGLFQRNEIYHTHNPGGIDGCALDFDIDTTNSIAQYNYTHDNGGPGLETYANGTGCIYRNNISVNDAYQNFASIYPQGSVGPIFAYNTIIKDGTGLSDKNIIANVNLPSTEIYGNIFDMFGGALFSTSVNTNELEGNDYWFNGGSFSVTLGGTTYTSLASMASGATQESINGTLVGQNVNPSFSATLTPGGGDTTLGPGVATSTLASYKLLSTSAIINNSPDFYPLNSGIGQFPSFDYLGTTEPSGLGYAVGAIAYPLGGYPATTSSGGGSGGTNSTINIGSPRPATLFGKGSPISF